MVEGLLKAGITEEQIVFFRIHMECDDEHAETLEKIMLSYAGTPDWYNTCYRSMMHALTIRERFFDKMYESMALRRLQPIIDNIQNRVSLAAELPSPSDLHFRAGAPGVPFHSNTNDRLNIDFKVERVPFKGDALDTQMLRIPSHKNNEKHKHAHETVFYVLKGEGKIQINESEVDMKAGDVVFVPRWAVHQTFNTAAEELHILAVSDMGLTDRAYLGDPQKANRL